MKGKQLTLFPILDAMSEKDYVPFVSEVDVPFVNEVEIPEKKEWMFVHDFIQEELAEYKEACERGDIIEVLDALCDITYVSTGNGTMLHGLKDKIWPAYQEVQASNMSKACKTEEEAIQTVSQRSKEQGEACHFERIEEGRYIVYRSRDRKVMKSIKYFRPNLKQFFTEDEIKRNLND